MNAPVSPLLACSTADAFCSGKTQYKYNAYEFD